MNTPTWHTIGQTTHGNSRSVMQRYGSQELTRDIRNDGNTVYKSYGTPIAFIDGDLAIYTNTTYSRTTSKHIATVKRELSKMVQSRMIRVSRVDDGNEIATFCRMNSVDRGRLQTV